MELICSVVSTICILCAPLVIWLIARGQRKSEKEAVRQALHEELAPLVGAKEAEARYQKCLADEAKNREPLIFFIDGTPYYAPEEASDGN